MRANFFIASYIVRLYRFKKNNRRSLVGVVEVVGARDKKAFTNYDELWDILNSPRSNLKSNPKHDMSSEVLAGEVQSAERKE
jgi:hypothetical protein